MKIYRILLAVVLATYCHCAMADTAEKISVIKMQHTCKILFDAQLLYDIGENDFFTIAMNDGKLAKVEGSKCEVNVPKIQQMGLYKGSEKNDTTGDLVVYYGLNTQLPDQNKDTFTDVSLIADVSRLHYMGNKYRHYSFILMLQPYTQRAKLTGSNKSFADFTYGEDTKWGNLSIGPNISNGQLDGTALYSEVSEAKAQEYYNNKYYVFNQLCNSDVVLCPVDKINYIKQSEKIFMRNFHVIGEGKLPSRWIMVNATENKKQIFVIPDQVMKNLFENPIFCKDKDYCYFPWLLVETMLVVQPGMPANEFDKIFPQGEIKVDLLKLKRTNDSDLNWYFDDTPFPKGGAFIITGAITEGNVFMSLDGLKEYLLKNQKRDNYSKLKKVYCFVKNMKRTKESETVIWKFPSQEELNCQLN